jgi:hypothetical protein
MNADNRNDAGGEKEASSQQKVGKGSIKCPLGKRT